MLRAQSCNLVIGQAGLRIDAEAGQDLCYRLCKSSLHSVRAAREHLRDG